MAFSLVQSKGNGSAAAANSVSVTLNAAVGSGNLIVGLVTFGNDGTNSISSITDDKGNTYNILDTSTDAGSLQSSSAFLLGNITNGPTTITAHISGNLNTNNGIVVDEYSGGLAAANPNDGFAAQKLSATGTDGLQSPSITTTINGDLIWGGTTNTNGTTAPAAGTGFTARNNDVSSGDCISTEDLVQSTAGAIKTTWSQTVGDPHLNFIVAIKPGAGVTTPTGWWPIDDRNPLPPLTPAARQQFLAAPPFPVAIPSFGWFTPLVDPTAKTLPPLPIASKQFLATERAPIIPSFGWFRYLDEPRVKTPPALPPGEHQFWSGPIAPVIGAIPSFAWYRALTEPVRQRPPVAWQQDTTGPSWSIITSPIVVTSLDRRSGTPGSSTYLTASISPAPNALVLVTVAADGGASVSGGGFASWTLVSQQGFPGRTISVYRALDPAPGSGQITLSFLGTNQTHIDWSVDQFTNVNTSNPVRQNASLGNSGTGTNLSVALAAFADSRSVNFSLLMTNDNVGNYKQNEFTYEANQSSAADDKLEAAFAQNTTQVTWSGWHSGDQAQAITLEIAAAIVPLAVFGWFQALAEPNVKTLPALPIPSQPFQAALGQVPITPSFDWFQALSRPVLPPPQPVRPFRSELWPFPLLTTVLWGWVHPLAEPRVKTLPGLTPSQQQSLALGQVPIIPSYGWFRPLDVPTQKTLVGLQVTLQQTLAIPLIRPVNVTATLNAIEQGDVFSAGGFPYTRTITARLGITLRSS